MIFGMTISTFTTVHVVLSLVGIFSGIRRPDRASWRETARRLDGALSGEHGVDERDRLFFPVDHFLPSHGVGIISLVVLAVADPGTLCVSSRGRLALDLRGWRGGWPVFECLRPDRAGLPEGARLESDSADTVRAAIPDRAACRDGPFHRAWHCRGEKVPQPVGRYGLIGYIAWGNIGAEGRE